MFRTVLISVITILQAYVFWRAQALAAFADRRRKAALLGSGALLWMMFVYARAFQHYHSGKMAAFLELAGMDWMGIVFLCAVCLLSAEIATGFGCLFPRTAPKARAAALAAGILLSAIGIVQGLRQPAVSDYEVELRNLLQERDGTVLVAMTDMHLGSLIGGRWLKARVEQVNALRPDLVALVGDIYDGRSVSANEFISEFLELRAPLGVWVAMGNHESYRDTAKHLGSFSQAGFRVLLNENASAAPGLTIAGVEDLTVKKRQGADRAALEKTMHGAGSGGLILLSHSPLLEHEAAEYGAGLMLSGHTHDGQLWPFNYLVKLRYPHIAGRYLIDGMTLLVCRGTGTWGPRMRLWRRGEILRVTLRAPHPKTN